MNSKFKLIEHSVCLNCIKAIADKPPLDVVYSHFDLDIKDLDNDCVFCDSIFDVYVVTLLLKES